MRTQSRLKLGAAAVLLATGCGPGLKAGDTEGVGSSDTAGGNTVATTSPVPTTDADADADADAGTDADADAAAGTSDEAGSSSGDASSGGEEDLNCCEAHSSATCNEPAVEACVCPADPNCCLFEWDGACAAAAQRDCKAECISGGGDAGTDDTGGTACKETTTFELLATDATLAGDWEYVMSEQGEGMVATIGGGDPSGTITFDVDVPCDDTFHIWVRWFEANAQADSFLATVDDTPDPAAVFEGDCVGGGGMGVGWTWSEMNWRDQKADPCEYIEDPWSFEWDAGAHSVVYGFREIIALARIVVTNDPGYQP